MYIHLRIDIIVWMCGIYSLSLPPSLTPSLSLHAVPGLFCAQHNQDCDSINGCDSISFCDRDLNVSHHDPAAHESCIAVAYLDNGEFVLGVRSYTRALHIILHTNLAL